MTGPVRQLALLAAIFLFPAPGAPTSGRLATDNAVVSAAGPALHLLQQLLHRLHPERVRHSLRLLLHQLPLLAHENIFLFLCNLIPSALALFLNTVLDLNVTLIPQLYLKKK